MRFLVDECTGPSVAAWLHAQGHEIFSVFDEDRGIGDNEVIYKAYNERAANNIEVLRRLLEAYADRLIDRFVVVTETQVRFARV